jgi:hypothetical protein
MHESMPKYLRVPASASNSRIVFEIFKAMKLTDYKDKDLDDKINRD